MGGAESLTPHLSAGRALGASDLAARGALPLSLFIVSLDAVSYVAVRGLVLRAVVELLLRRRM